MTSINGSIIEASSNNAASEIVHLAADIIIKAQEDPNTRPGHWAGALWRAGMLVAPGSDGVVLDDSDGAAQDRA